MEKEKFELFEEVLRRLEGAGILKEIMVAGSWNVHLYNSYFGKDAAKIPPIRTLDVDFLIPHPKKIASKQSIPLLLKDLGYLTDYRGEAGFIRLIHPDLIIEFLVPEKGRGTDDKPVPLQGLGVNASAMRFMDVLYENKITIRYKGIKVSIAHPAALAIHYLLIYPRRKNRKKAEKNLMHALAILNLLVSKRKQDEMRFVFLKLHSKWKKEVLELLDEKGDHEIAGILKV